MVNLVPKAQQEDLESLVNLVNLESLETLEGWANLDQKVQWVLLVKLVHKAYLA